MEEKSPFQKFEINLTDYGIDMLRETAKWAYFLSILGFVGIGFMVIIALFAGTIFSAVPSATGGILPGATLTIIYLLMAGLYFMPVFYLYKFSSNVKAAIRDNNTSKLNDGLTFLKSHYKFIGILTIVILSLYVLAFVVAIAGGIFTASSGGF